MERLKNLLAECVLKIQSEIFVNGVLYVQAEYGRIENSSLPQVTKINNWTNLTNAKYLHSVGNLKLNENSNFLLDNSIHFNGIWKNSFPQSQTFQSTFWINQTQPRQIEFMRQKNRFLFHDFRFSGYSALKIFYSNDHLSLLVLLPKRRMGIVDLESRVHQLNIKFIESQLRMRTVDVFLPKFIIDHEISSNNALLGVMFNENNQFFSKEYFLQAELINIFSSDADLSQLLPEGAKFGFNQRVIFKNDERGVEEDQSISKLDTKPNINVLFKIFFFRCSNFFNAKIVNT